MAKKKCRQPKQKGRGRYSLKWGMVRMLLLCWVLPVYLIVGGAGLYILHSMTVQTRATVQSSAETALMLTADKLNAAVASSRKASYTPTVKDAWQAYCQNGEAVELYTKVNAFLYQQYKYDEKFLNTVLTFTQDPSLSFYVSNATAGGNSVGVRKYHTYLEPSVLALSPSLGTDIAFVQQENHCFLVRNLLDSNYQPYAVLVNELNSSALFGDLAGMSWATDVTVWVSGQPVTLCGAEQPCPAEDTQGVFLSAEGDTLLLAAGRRGDACTLLCAARIEPSGLRSQRTSTLVTLLLISALLVPLIGAGLLFFRRSVTRPLEALNGAARRIEQGEFGTQVESALLASRELGSLGDSFNAMSSTLLNQFERIYKEELALRDARIMALQSQINPHFLNNTLEIINWEARMAGDLKVCSMLESLSTMLSAAMDRKKRPLVHLSEEMMYVDAYLYIIGERLGKRLTVERAVPEVLLDCYVPRLVLQPILENAIEHGINPSQHGTVWVRAREENGWLLLEVENDGVTTEEDLSRICSLLCDAPAPQDEPSLSLGIRNVHQRLRILYGSECGLSVTITKKGTTLCTLKMEKQQERQ